MSSFRFSLQYMSLTELVSQSQRRGRTRQVEERFRGFSASDSKHRSSPTIVSTRSNVSHVKTVHIECGDCTSEQQLRRKRFPRRGKLILPLLSPIRLAQTRWTCASIEPSGVQNLSRRPELHLLRSFSRSIRYNKRRTLHHRRNTRGVLSDHRSSSSVGQCFSGTYQ